MRSRVTFPLAGVDFREKTLDIDGEIFKVGFVTFAIPETYTLAFSCKFGTLPDKVCSRKEMEDMSCLRDSFAERFRRSMINHYYRNVHAIVYVYDVTNLASFENLPVWINECDKHILDQDLPRVLVGNKCDVSGEDVVVPNAVAQRFAVRATLSLSLATSHTRVSVPGRS